jgi:hypothetical protein
MLNLEQSNFQTIELGAFKLTKVTNAEVTQQALP